MQSMRPYSRSTVLREGLTSARPRGEAAAGVRAGSGAGGGLEQLDHVPEQILGQDLPPARPGDEPCLRKLTPSKRSRATSAAMSGTIR
jgi:hypothetical protein